MHPTLLTVFIVLTVTCASAALFAYWCSRLWMLARLGIEALAYRLDKDLAVGRAIWSMIRGIASG